MTYDSPRLRLISLSASLACCGQNGGHCGTPPPPPCTLLVAGVCLDPPLLCFHMGTC